MNQFWSSCDKQVPLSIKTTTTTKKKNKTKENKQRTNARKKMLTCTEKSTRSPKLRLITSGLMQKGQDAETSHWKLAIRGKGAHD